MASRKPTHCSFYIRLIYFILPNKVVLDYNFTDIWLITENTMGMKHLKNDGPSDYI